MNGNSFCGGIRLCIPLPFIFRIAGMFPKHLLIGVIQLTTGVLECLGVNFRKPGKILFHDRQEVLHLVIGKMFLPTPVDGLLPRKHSIVNISAASKRLVDLI